MSAQTFASLGAFASHLDIAAMRQALEITSGLREVATAIQKTAQGKLGEYQGAVDHFDAWQELADSTKADRVAKGYTEDDPLLRSGELRKSIGTAVSLTEATIGSTEDSAVYNELGTTKAPPRPFLGPSVIENEGLIKERLGAACVRGILGPGVKVPTQMTHKVIR
jgi:phage gpG-like protein